ncbi:putative DNA-binding protein [Kitasatospora setae KM-6054]|uniref:Putative DNA-binding protein n=1 Tax=Kitasatospora setae (strain ATCC 33774 / DSM 43861 / JCM 3304 / KCC A-0304 / NBRC 14216 / KM-6054) TaxID=452652 RepID=E4NB19_KITSK|nr:putative DNA-binding protein [Kitasatospora setae KM-6054]
MTTPQTRRRQTTETARTRLDRIFPADLPAQPDPVEPSEDGVSTIGSADAGSPEPDRPDDPQPALPSARLPATQGAPAHPARSVPDTTRATARPDPRNDSPPFLDHGRPGTRPERDPPHRTTDDNPPPDGPTTGGRPGSEPEPESEPDPEPASDLPSAGPAPPANPADASHRTPPKLPLRFRLPTAFALDRRAVLGLTVLLVLATGYAVQHFWLGRPRPVPVPVIAMAGPASDQAPEGASVLQPTGPSLVIDIAGKVQRPGLRTLPAGSRVADALTAAGGPLPGTDTSLLNLARPLTDGEQILVGTDPPPGGTTPTGRAGPVSLNHAGADQLDSLPGVGPALAQRILQYRLAHGPFQSLDQLRHVPGIGPRKYEDLKPLLTL